MSTRTVLAGDLGGTKCRFALVGEDFAVHAVQHVPTVRERPPFLAALERAITAVLAAVPAGHERPRAAGFGTAGVIPRDGRSIDRAPNLPLDGFPLAQFVEDRFGLATTLLNDGRASAWGEYLRGHARAADPLLCLFFGTGIGIGLIVDGRPFGGSNNAAGEIGHTTFRPGGRRCPCGGLGHFEAYCGGRAITERAEELLGRAGDGAWTVGSVVAAASRRGRAFDPRRRRTRSRHRRRQCLHAAQSRRRRARRRRAVRLARAGAAHRGAGAGVDQHRDHRRVALRAVAGRQRCDPVGGRRCDRRAVRARPLSRRPSERSFLPCTRVCSVLHHGG
jgi:predicted NBD/HSP70 family sugar kinase